MIVVFDTNIYLSALITPGGICDQLFCQSYIKRYRLCVSPDILTELKKVLEIKFRFSENESMNIIDRITSNADIVYPRIRVDEIKENIADNRILECAMEAMADYLVSGDKKHILPLKKFRETKIVSPKQFYDQLTK